MNQSNDRRLSGEMTRRKFAGITIGSSAALITGGPIIMQAAEAATMESRSTFKIGGELTVNRLGFGAMRITGDGVWGWPKDRAEAVKVLKRAVDLGVNL